MRNNNVHLLPTAINKSTTLIIGMKNENTKQVKYSNDVVNRTMKPYKIVDYSNSPAHICDQSIKLGNRKFFIIK